MSHIVVAAPHSGSGKTTFCMGLMASLVNRGMTVQPCKVGPDYIDTAYHTRICGRPAANLDGWLMEYDVLRKLFARRGAEADIAVIEGVMGLYDGMGDTAQFSTAEVARELQTPVLLVVNARGMAASAAALVKGFQSYDPNVTIGGVVFNDVSSESHYNLLCTAVERDCGMRCYGYLPRAQDVEIASRHLGILPAAEVEDADRRIERLAQLVEEHVDIGGLLELAASAPPLSTEPVPTYGQIPCRLAVAQDKAFNFYYEDGLNVLEAMGAELMHFSPLQWGPAPRLRRCLHRRRIPGSVRCRVGGQFRHAPGHRRGVGGRHAHLWRVRRLYVSDAVYRGQRRQPLRNVRRAARRGGTGQEAQPAVRLCGGDPAYGYALGAGWPAISRPRVPP